MREENSNDNERRYCQKESGGSGSFISLLEIFHFDVDGLPPRLASHKYPKRFFFSGEKIKAIFCVGTCTNNPSYPRLPPPPPRNPSPRYCGCCCCCCCSFLLRSPPPPRRRRRRTSGTPPSCQGTAPPRCNPLLLPPTASPSWTAWGGGQGGRTSPEPRPAWGRGRSENLKIINTSD